MYVCACVCVCVCVCACMHTCVCACGCKIAPSLGEKLKEFIAFLVDVTQDGGVCMEHRGSQWVDFGEI